MPLCIDLYCGLGGWADGFLAEGWEVIGFDTERHRYPKPAAVREFGRPGEPDPHIKQGGSGPVWFDKAVDDRRRTVPFTSEWDEYPGHLILQDVLTLHGSQFKHADCIVASPPCQRYSYMAMPWKRGKAQAAEIRADMTGSKLDELNALFNACFRIQREACEAAGRHIPMVVENVRGAQPWVGQARWSYGSYYLWGDVPALMPFTAAAQKRNPDGTNHGQGSWFAIADSQKRGGRNFHGPERGTSSPSFNGGEHETRGVKFISPGHYNKPESGPDWFDQHPAGSNARKAASALIAKIPFELARWIASVYYPR